MVIGIKYRRYFYCVLNPHRQLLIQVTIFVEKLHVRSAVCFLALNLRSKQSLNQSEHFAAFREACGIMVWLSGQNKIILQGYGIMMNIMSEQG